MHFGDILEPSIGVWVGFGDVLGYLGSVVGMFLHLFQVSWSIFSVFLRSRGVLDAVWRHLGSVVKAFWRRPGASTECFS